MQALPQGAPALAKSGRSRGRLTDGAYARQQTLTFLVRHDFAALNAAQFVLKTRK
jgi:hypothetical protein